MPPEQLPNRGLKFDPIVIDDHGIFGSNHSFLKGPPIRPNMDWTDALPVEERQSRESAGTTFDTQSCATFGTDNQVEMYMRAVFGIEVNYSDRFLSKASGTTPQGNDPHKVLETLRTGGTVLEEIWPWTPDIMTWAQYFADIPRAIYASATAWTTKYTLNHDWVPTTPASIKSALQFSPIAASVYELIDENGLYYKPDGFRDTHWAVIVKALPNGNWVVFDTYPPFLKVFRADFKFERAKVISIIKEPVNQTWFKAFLDWLAKYTGIKNSTTPDGVKAPVPNVTPQPAPQPPQPQTRRLEAFCLAIRDFEGKPGDLNYRNNNPGNCRCSQVGYDPKYGPVQCMGGFAVFESYEMGWLYLNNLVRRRIEQNRSWNFYDFFAVYAPASDSNDPHRYAETVAAQLGMAPTAKLTSLL